MPLSDVYRVSDRLVLARKADVTRLEKSLKVTMPEGYREYVTTLGSGEYGGHLHVMLPKEIKERLLELRSLHASMFADNYGDAGDQPISQEDADQCVQVAETMDGDCFVVCPRLPGKLFLLPRGDTQVRQIGSGLSDPDALCPDDPSGNWRDYFIPANGLRKPRTLTYKSTTTIAEFLALCREQFGADVRTRQRGKPGDGVEVFVRAITAKIIAILPPEAQRLSLTCEVDDNRSSDLDQFLQLAEQRLGLEQFSTVVRPTLPPEPKTALSATLGPLVIRETFALEGKDRNETFYAAFSSDETRLFACVRNSARLIDVATRDVIASLPTDGYGFVGAAFSPDGQWIAASDSDHSLHLLRTSGLEVVFRAPGMSSFADLKPCIAFSADGGRLVTANQSRIQLWAFDSPGNCHLLHEHPRGANEELLGAAFRGDGTPIAVRSEEEQTIAWNLETGEEVFRLPTNGRKAAAFSPAHDLLALPGPGRSTDIWQLATGTLHLRLDQVNDSPGPFAFHPSGDWLAVGAMGVWLWNLTASREESRLGRFPLPIQTLGFSAQGNYLAAAGLKVGTGVLMVFNWAEVEAQLKAHHSKE